MALAPITAEQRKLVEDNIHLDYVKLNFKRNQLVQWMRKQPHLPQLPDSFAEKMATVYLIGTKLSAPKAENKIDLFYSLRHQLTNVFRNLDPLQDQVKDSLEKIYYFPLTELTPEANRVHILLLGCEKDKLFNFKDFLGFYKRAVGIQLSRILQDEFCRGEIMVCDFRGVYFSHIAELNWVTINKFTAFAQEGLPFSPKKVLMINCPGFIETILNIMKPALKGKIWNRIHVFKGDHTNLYKFVPQRILPSDYGGEAPSLKEYNNCWQKTIESMRDFILEDEKRLTDEMKRPRESMNKYSDIFGINGTFTKLSID